MCMLPGRGDTGSDSVMENSQTVPDASSGMSEPNGVTGYVVRSLSYADQSRERSALQHCERTLCPRARRTR